MKTEDKILSFVIQQFQSRDLLDNDAFEQMFGCKSFVASGIKKILEE